MRRRRENGFIPIEMVLAIGVLMIPAAMLALAFPQWVERQSLARVAAREAARTVAQAQTYEQGIIDATTVINEMANNHDVPPGDMTVSIEGSINAGDEVTATVTVQLPLLWIPIWGGEISPDAPLKVEHTEKVDEYRSQ